MDRDAGAVHQLDARLDQQALVMWGRDFYITNYKHPALASWIIDAAFGLLGVHLWVLYLLGLKSAWWRLSSSFYRLGRALLDEPRAIVAPMLLVALDYFGDLGTKLPNQNLVQVLFWAGFAWFLWQASERRAARWWLLAAAMAAIGLYGKFSMAMPIAFGCAWIVGDPRTRAQLRTWQPYAALALFLGADRAAALRPLAHPLHHLHLDHGRVRRQGRLLARLQRQEPGASSCCASWWWRCWPAPSASGGRTWRRRRPGLRPASSPTCC